MNQSESIKELATALAKVQSTIQPASKNATNPHFKSKYADLGAIWDACRKPLADNGLSIVQMPTDSGDGRVALTTMLIHTSGEYISSTCSTRLQQDSAQGVGSALTYLRRYTLAAMVGIVADEDDDGNAASQPQQRDPTRQPERPRLPTEQNGVGAPKTPQDAEQRFYTRYSEVIRGREWINVQQYLGSRAAKPTTVEGWIAAGEAVRNQAQTT